MTTGTMQPDATKAWKSVNIEVLRRAEELPSLSTVVSEFLDLTKREFFSAKDFEIVISKDQALVARLLKVANSGLYGKPRGVRSIPEAVVLVGLENMKKIVFSVSMEGLTRLRLKNYDYEPSRGYWMHSTAVGLSARALIEVLPNKPMHGEEAFVAGLLHDVGKLVIDDFLDPQAGTRDVSLEEEKKAAGLDHAELAEYVLRNWRLPENIVTAICNHHTTLPADGVEAGAVVMQLAQEIVNTWQVGHGEPIDLSIDYDPDRHLELIEQVGLPPSKIPQLVWDVRQSLSGIERLYYQD
jgi:putative nucleotidyltransferase with HDIG domain